MIIPMPYYKCIDLFEKVEESAREGNSFMEGSRNREEGVEENGYDEEEEDGQDDNPVSISSADMEKDWAQYTVLASKHIWKVININEIQRIVEETIKKVNDTQEQIYLKHKHIQGFELEAYLMGQISDNIIYYARKKGMIKCGTVILVAFKSLI